MLISQLSAELDDLSTTMSLAPPLRVPLGIPGRAQRVFDGGAPWEHQCADTRTRHSTTLDDAWAPPTEPRVSDLIATWFHPDERQRCVGEARIAVGCGSCVTVYTQEVLASVRESPSSHRSHRRSNHVLSQALGHSPPQSPLRMLGSRTASSQSSASWRESRWDAAPSATVGTTHTRVSHGATASFDSPFDAEDLLEKQYRSHVDAPVITHPQGTTYEPHVHVHSRHTPKAPHTAPPVTLSGVYTDTHVDTKDDPAEPVQLTRKQPRAFRRLVTPDDSPVVHVLVSDGTCELPGVSSVVCAFLFVLQESGRLTAWRLDTLTLCSSTRLPVEMPRVPGMPPAPLRMVAVSTPPSEQRMVHLLAGNQSTPFLVECDLQSGIHVLHSLSVPEGYVSSKLSSDGELSVYVASEKHLTHLVFPAGSPTAPLESNRTDMRALAQVAGCESDELVSLHATPDAVVVGFANAVLVIGTETCTAVLPSTLCELHTALENRILCICEEHLVVVDVRGGQAVVEHADVLEERQKAALSAYILPNGQTSTLEGTPTETEPPAPTAILPLTMTRIIISVGGGIAMVDMTAAFSSAQVLPAPGSVPTWCADITVLQHLCNPRTGTNYILGGSDHGDICVFDTTTLRVEAEWSGFSTPLQHVVPLVGLPHTSRLYGCVLCVARDGTSGLLLLDDLRLVQLFPGTDSPLVRVAARGHELLLQYGKHGRVWDVQTQQLVSSISGDQLRILLAAGDWRVYDVPESPRGTPLDGGTQAGMLAMSGAASRAVSVLDADMRRCLDTTTKIARGALGAPGFSMALEAALHGERTSSVIPRDNPAAAKIIAPVGMLQRIFLPQTAAQEASALLTGPPLGAVAADGSEGFLSVSMNDTPGAALQATPEVSAQWLLSATALTLLTSLMDGLRDDSVRVLKRLVDPSRDDYCAPSLAVLARHVVDQNETLRAAARLLFRPYCATAEPSALIRLTDSWSAQLSRNGVEAGALLVLGLVAAEQFAYMSPVLLKQVSQTVAQCVSPRAPPEHAAVALELCSTGFGIWQHYVDAVALVRGIFELATDEKADIQLRSAARRATLALAAQHGPLFMSTLAMDILHPPSAHFSQVALRLVAFIVRHKPLALYPSLPRLAEVVVKSLDPTAARSSMIQAATVMINELVQTYPSISFHRESQRLAVGTHDGPVVLYDLKSGTRYCVLSGHAKGVTACSFSPDGRRFLSMSLEEERVLIWNIGTGLLNMLPNAVARVAGGGNDNAAHKAIKFHLGLSVDPSGAFILSQVSFEWPNSRNVRMHVGEASVTIGM